jgi:hypothetical protein
MPFHVIPACLITILVRIISLEEAISREMACYSSSMVQFLQQAVGGIRALVFWCAFYSP